MAPLLTSMLHRCNTFSRPSLYHNPFSSSSLLSNRIDGVKSLLLPPPIAVPAIAAPALLLLPIFLLLFRINPSTNPLRLRRVSQPHHRDKFGSLPRLRRVSMKTNRVEMYIPPHIISEIFFRVPYKSLVRLKATCKQWYVLINDRRFVDEYRIRAANINPLYFLVCASASSTCRNFLLYNGGRDSYTYMKTMTLSNCYEAVLPSSYGLVCIHGVSNRKIAIFDPVSEKMMPLPDLPEPYIYDPKTLDYNYLGFGFDPQSRQYKVVQLVHDSSRCYILTVGHGELSWRVLDAILPVRSGRFECCAGGVLYWGTWSSNPVVGFVRIITFDLSCEKIDEMLLPCKCPLDMNGPAKHLVELQGKLCSVDFVFNGESLQMDISMLKCSEWSHFYRLELGKRPSNAYFRFFPLCVRDDRILLMDDGALYSYDIKDKSLGYYEGNNGDQTLSYWFSSRRAIVWDSLPNHEFK